MIGEISKTERSGCGATVSSDLVRLLLESIDVDRTRLSAILSKAGIDPAILSQSHRRIPSVKFGLLWDEMERASQDPNFGLHMGELRCALPWGHVLLAAIMNSATVGQAIERTCRYHDIMSDIVRPTLTLQADKAAVGLSTPRPGFRLHRQHVESIFSAVVSILRLLAKERFSCEMHFVHQRPDDVTEHTRILGPSVLFGRPADLLLFDRSLMDLRIPYADPELASALDRHAEKVLNRIRSFKPWSEKLAELLIQSMVDGLPSLREVSRRMSMSPRCLQGRLEAESSSYRQVVESVRKDLAIDYLKESDMPVGEIAFVLGFSHQSAFNHAFKRWTGRSPLAFRNDSGQ